MIDLELLEARWRVGHILTSDLAGISAELAGAGHDVPALRKLLATPREELPLLARDLFEEALRELGGGTMTASDAALLLARRFAAEILAGRITPRAGTRAIARVRWKGHGDVDDVLRPFWELDERYERASGALGGLATRRVDHAVRREASALLGG